MDQLSQPTERVAALRRRRTRILGVAGAVVAALAVWAIGVGLFGIDLLVSGGTVAVTSIFFESLIAALIGWAVLALLEHFSTRYARTIWTVGALAVLLLSLALPLTGAVTTTAKITLALMHLAVGAVLITTLRRTSPSP
ncbi:MAG: hypothetical protein DLM59_01185 [Pseudonocardiales bacterium]|nr:MAG: hypothetical protein DLM59_01185 [Pseudonocardiales bacterium]